MAKLRINGDSSGYVDLEAPNAASSSTLDLDQVPQKNAANVFTTAQTIQNDNAYFAGNLTESSNAAIALRVTPTRAGQTKGISLGSIGKNGSSSTGIQAYDTSDNSSNTLELNPHGGAVTAPSQPSFYARLHASFSSTTDGAEIVPASSFSSQWNTGSGFSGNRFTAPVAGKYMFIFSAEKANNYSSVSVGLSIFKNGAEFPNARLYDSNQNTRKTLQYTMIMDMAVNDYAEPFIYSYQTGSAYDNRGHFAGYLIG